jgi:hypothetical protein
MAADLGGVLDQVPARRSVGGPFAKVPAVARCSIQRDARASALA